MLVLCEGEFAGYAIRLLRDHLGPYGCCLIQCQLELRLVEILIEEPRTSFTSTNCIPRIGIQDIAFVIELRDLLAHGQARWIRCDVPLHNISGSLGVPCFYLIRRKREQSNEAIRNSFFLVLVS